MSRAAATICAIVLAAPLRAQVAAPLPQPTRPPPRDAAGLAAAATGTGRIRGRVLQAGTTTPLRRAQVSLTGEQNVRRLVTTDGEGRYEFSDLPAGRFTISAAKGGYLTLQYGQRRPFEPGRPVTLTAAQALGQVDLALPRGGAIAGKVTDRFGEPAVGADIVVERYQYSSDGQRRLTRAPGATIANDLGEFRVFGLMPGEYIVSANMRQRPTLPGGGGGPATPVAGYVQTYSPGTTSVADAQAVVLGVGEEATVQFGLALGRLSRVSGRITDSTGRPAAGAELMLVTLSASGTGSGRGSGSVAADGSFSIGNVAPGDHFIQVRVAPRPDGPAAPEIANAPISLSDQNIDGLQIMTGPATTVAGMVQWEGSATRAGSPPASPLRITATPADGRPPLLGLTGAADPGANGTVGADDTFRLSGLLGRVRFMASGVPPQWMLKTITLGDADLTTTDVDAASIGRDARVRVVLTDTVTELTGSVRNAQGELVTEYVVVVLPVEMVNPAIASRYTHALRPDQKGVFRLRALPPGTYVAAAVDALEQGSEWDPAFQAAVRNGARRFALSEGQTMTLTLDLTP
jgi:hypothetical protein